MRGVFSVVGRTLKLLHWRAMLYKPPSFLFDVLKHLNRELHKEIIKTLISITTFPEHCSDGEENEEESIENELIN